MHKTVSRRAAAVFLSAWNVVIFAMSCSKQSGNGFVDEPTY